MASDVDPLIEDLLRGALHEVAQSVSVGDQPAAWTERTTTARTTLRSPRTLVTAGVAVVVVVVAAAAFAAHNSSARHGVSVVATATSSTAPSTAPTEYEVDALVEQHKPAAPVLCLHLYAVAYTLQLSTNPSSESPTRPPACDVAPRIRGWEWTGLAAVRSGNAIWGDFHVVGTYDGTTFTVTRKPVATTLSDTPPPHVPPIAPCPAPKGGWRVTEASKVTLDRYQALDAAAYEQPDLAGIWVDNSTPVDGRVPGLGDFPLEVQTFAFTGHIAQHRAALTAIWGGPICVVQHAHTRVELGHTVTAIEGSVGKRLGLQVIDAESDEVDDRVNVTTIVVTPALQAAVDRRFGSGTVQLTSVLTPIGASSTTTTPPKVLAVPNVLGLSLKDAFRALSAVRLDPSSQTARSSTVPSGHVISQDPAPNSRVPLGAFVRIVVSGGP